MARRGGGGEERRQDERRIYICQEERRNLAGMPGLSYIIRKQAIRLYEYNLPLPPLKVHKL
jgi:hypothetical protein